MIKEDDLLAEKNKVSLHADTEQSAGLHPTCAVSKDFQFRILTK